MADVKATVTGVDTYRWVDADGAIQSADRGDEITVTERELDRVPGALTRARGDAVAGGYPTTQEGLDALAAANDFNFSQHTRTESEKIRELTAAGIDPTSGPSASELGYPTKQADLDQLAVDNDYTWPEGVTTVKQKQAALQQAGISPPTG